MNIDEQRAHLTSLIEGANLSASADAILGSVRESLRLFPLPATDDTTAVGASRFGGSADLTSPDAWPQHAGLPLVFIAQIRLEDIAHELGDNPLPAAGLLSFFAFDLRAEGEPSDEAYEAYGHVGAVLYSATPATLVSVEPPYSDELRCHSIRFEPELCVPPVEGPDIDAVGLDEDASSAYWDDVWMNRAFLTDEPFHRLLGHPDMNYNYHMKGTRLLLQLCADDDIGWEFGDAQELRFLIPPEALAAARFDAASVNGDEE